MCDVGTAGGHYGNVGTRLVVWQEVYRSFTGRGGGYHCYAGHRTFFVLKRKRYYRIAECFVNNASLLEL